LACNKLGWTLNSNGHYKNKKEGLTNLEFLVMVKNMDIYQEVGIMKITTYVLSINLSTWALQGATI
jgi:hypothetical protein